MNAVAPDEPECARKGLRSPADMQSLFRAATEADTGATRPLPASLAVAQRGEKGGQNWAAWRKCGACREPWLPVGTVGTVGTVGRLSVLSVTVGNCQKLLSDSCRTVRL